MIDADVIATRLLKLNEAVGNLESHGEITTARLTGDAVLRAAVERWLQVAIEACADIAFHVVAAEGWMPPESARAAFFELASHGLIDADLAARLSGAVSMRNVLVHQYAVVDLEKVVSAVRNDLADLKRFGSAIGMLLGQT